jgi:hypothetical protein
MIVYANVATLLAVPSERTAIALIVAELVMLTGFGLAALAAVGVEPSIV